MHPRSKLEDVQGAYQAADYRFSAEPREHDRVWQEKAERFLENSRIGDILAMAGLHYCYSKGLGVEKDGRQALHWARLAYDSERAEGKHVYGRCLLNGIGTEKNEAAGWKLIEEAAAGGFSISQLSLAERDLKEMERTQEFEADRLARARDLTEKAAATGLARAKEQLALLHLFAAERSGIRRDVKRAIELLEAAAGAGLPSSQAELAKVYTGQLPDTPKDLEKAKKLLTQAAEAGHAPAQHILAGEYSREDGSGSMLGLKQDRDRARRWFELAAGQDFTPSLIELSRMYEAGTIAPIDLGKARRYCERAAELNDPQAFVIQGAWYADGKIYDRDDFRAMDLFRRAADRGDPKGCRMVGWMYDQARGVPLRGHSQQEMIPFFKFHALHWHVRAVKLGDDPESKKALAEFRKEMVKEQNLAMLRIPPASPSTPRPSQILKEFRAEYPESAKEFDRIFKIGREESPAGGLIHKDRTPE